MVGDSAATIYLTSFRCLHEIPKNEDEAKDAVQQIFLKALNELEKYPVEYPKSWLYKIACNYCLMKLRDQKAHISIDNAPSITEIYETENTSYIEREINLDLLETALEELNKEQKTCITLFYLQKKSLRSWDG